MTFPLRILGLCACLVAGGAAKILPAAPSVGNLAARIAAAPPGATLRVAPGVYSGPLVIDKPVTLVGRPGAVIDGHGRGTVVLIKASNVTFSGFTVRATGSSLDQEDTGIKVLGSNETIVDNTLQDVLFGIYLKSSNNSLVAGNHIIGKPLPLPVRGDAIRLWYCMNCQIQHNIVSQARDIILWFSNHCQIENNVFAYSRYGLHLMYDRGVEITGNTLTQNFVGAFLMYSWNVTFERNVLLDNRGISGYGIGVKNINNLRAEDNRFLDNEVGIFMNSSPSSLGVTNVFRRNVVAFNDVGLSLDPSNQGNNVFTLNSFLENLQQVANTGGGQLEGDSFAADGRGNFWSDYTGYPGRSADVGAVPYQVRSLFDNLTDQYDELKLFRFSPSEEAIELAAAAFPLVQPDEVLTDPDPLISPAPVHAAPLTKPPARGLVTAAGLLLGLAGLLAALLGAPTRSPEAKKVSHTMSKCSRPLLEIRSLRKNFGQTEVLRGITVTVDRGHAVALWGDNGAGKSTTIKCVVGLLDYTGAIAVAGVDAKANGKAARRLIGYVPQELRFYDDWSVRRTMAFYADLKRVARGEIPALLKEVGLEPHARKAVSALSGGMKQRLALAIALLGRPEVLLLDEFTASLDAEARAGLLDLLKQQRRKGLTVVFTTHRADEVEALADRVEMMQGGRILVSVTVEEFVRRREIVGTMHVEDECDRITKTELTFKKPEPRSMVPTEFTGSRHLAASQGKVRLLRQSDPNLRH
ncbi:MAG TPA: nitrous oxide reductase family maturation protein NosD [Terriglobia bacterium]|nr:nitrous oxide reductase family maturation protein NosD [Terriglobia bacterium]